MNKPKIYLSVIDDDFAHACIGISSVPQTVTNDEWEKHAIEIVPNPARRPRLRIDDAVTNLRNVLSAASSW